MGGRARSVWVAATVIALLWGIGVAVAHAWTTDDAFISFRYAEHLVEGHGLVFNEGERVEGYSNFLWTVWVAVGLLLGVGAETWANAWGIAAYAATIALLAWNTRTLDPGGGRWVTAVPVAAILAAAHPDWANFATGGLETSFFALLVTGATLAAAGSDTRPRLAVLAGALLGLASLTRPDGVVVAFAIGSVMLVLGPARFRSAAALTATFAVVWVPFVIWRTSYYGSFQPNTYYAKSAWLAWYGQGLCYLKLYAMKYGGLLVFPVLAAALSRRSPRVRAPRRIVRQAAFAGAVAVLYTAYVVRVGGDFMYARFLIPVTPLYALLCELAWRPLAGRRPRTAVALAAALAASVLVLPTPVTGERWICGIADEHAFYSDERVRELDRKAEVLRETMHGIPVRVAWIGAEARVVYEADLAVAIECHGGLTDPVIARRPLERRGRPGHEKRATLDYLIDVRRAHVTISTAAGAVIGTRGRIPTVMLDFGDGVVGQVLHWDPEIMAALRDRGVDIPDFPGMIDAYVREIDRRPRDEVARDYELLRRFYFDPVGDPARERPFLRRLGAS